MPYRQLSDEHLASFFVEIRRLIKKGTLSVFMYQEIDLIENTARERGITKTALLKIYLEKNPFVSTEKEKQYTKNLS